MEKKDQKQNEYFQPSVHADWKGRPSPGPRGNSGPDDVNAQGHPEGDPEQKTAARDRRDDMK